MTPAVSSAAPPRAAKATVGARPVRRKIKRPEQALHIQVAQFLRYALPPEIIWYHPPNGGLRTKSEAALMKVMGVRAGVPDLAFVLPSGHAAFIELKAVGGEVTPDQHAFRAACERVGALWAVCRSVDAVETKLTEWLADSGLALKARLS